MLPGWKYKQVDDVTIELQEERQLFYMLAQLELHTCIQFHTLRFLFKLWQNHKLTSE